MINCSKQRPQDYIDCILDLREYDVPYHVRFSIDNGRLFLTSMLRLILSFCAAYLDLCTVSCTRDVM